MRRLKMGDLTSVATLLLGIVFVVFIVYLLYQYEGFQGGDAGAAAPSEKKEKGVTEKEKSGDVAAGSDAVVTAPGVLRPANASSERPTFPAAVNLAEDRPFETYVQMLVRSEMAAQGVPTNEPFQIEEVVRNASSVVHTAPV